MLDALEDLDAVCVVRVFLRLRGGQSSSCRCPAQAAPRSGAGGVRGAVARTPRFYQSGATGTAVSGRGNPGFYLRFRTTIRDPGDPIAAERFGRPTADLFVEESGLSAPWPGGRRDGQDARFEGRRSISDASRSPTIDDHEAAS